MTPSSSPLDGDFERSTANSTGNAPAYVYTRVPSHLAGRLLFANPVCFLVTQNSDGGHNVMTISWLTPVDNRGNFVLSMNSNRHSLRNLQSRSSPTCTSAGGAGHGDSSGAVAETATAAQSSAIRTMFTLNPAVEGMQGMLLAVGGVSGSTLQQETSHAADAGEARSGKPQLLGLPLCRPGGDAAAEPLRQQQASGSSNKKAKVQFPLYADGVRCVADCPAHLVCEVVRQLLPASHDDGGGGLDLGHHVMLCRIIEAFVQPAYWTTGKTFGPPALSSSSGSTVVVAGEFPAADVSPASTAPPPESTCATGTIPASPAPRPPPLLTFMGSKQFATMVPQPPGAT